MRPQQALALDGRAVSLSDLPSDRPRVFVFRGPDRLPRMNASRVTRSSRRNRCPTEPDGTTDVGFARDAGGRGARDGPQSMNSPSQDLHVARQKPHRIPGRLPGVVCVEAARVSDRRAPFGPGDRAGSARRPVGA